MKMFLASLLLALSAGVVLPGVAHAQAGDLLQSVRQGGGWVEIPITAGSGTLRTDAVPTLGLTLEGCINVWPGHSGEWSLQARDPLNGGSLDVTAIPGEGVPFSYQTGLRSRLDVRVRWSEPGDTTLLLWVGLDGMAPGRADPCDPVYAKGAADGA